MTYHGELEVPRNVRLVSPTGRTIPLETVYAGQDGDGIHQWQATISPSLGDVAGWALRADELPAKSGIRILLLADGDAENDE